VDNFTGETTSWLLCDDRNGGGGDGGGDGDGFCSQSLESMLSVET